MNQGDYLGVWTVATKHSLGPGSTHAWGNNFIKVHLP